MKHISNLSFIDQVDRVLADAKYAKIDVRVAQYMRPNPSVLNVDAKLQDAMKIILEERIDAVPIVDYDNAIVGIITKTHALREIYRGGDINASVTDVMKKDLTITSPDEDSVALIKIPIGNIPVVDNGHLVGLVTIPDTVRACVASFVMLQDELKTIINSTHNGIITCDVNGKMRLINPAAEKMLNISRFDVLGKEISNTFLKLKMKEVIATGKTVLAGKLFYRGRILITSVGPVKHYDSIVGAIAVLQDISDFESISDELRYTKELKNDLNTIIESSFDGIYLSDNSGKILQVNDAFTRITGIEKEEIINRTTEELYNDGIFKQSIPLADIHKGKPVTISQEVKTGKSILVTSNPIFENNIVTRIVHNVRDITELNKLRDRLEKVERLSQHYQDQLKIMKSSGKYISKAPKTKALIDLVMRISKVDATVLLLGESGVGKDLIAEILHENSLRKDRVMITINCAAIPENLLESELFGYEPGAFTGAHKKGKIGMFELANGSSLFLDEIGELPLALQSKLLRVLHKRELTRLGGNRPIKVDVRIIAATNRALQEMVTNKLFREDLYYRLNVVRIQIPPLRERKEEIPELVWHFTQIFNKKYGFNKRFDGKVILEFLNSEWPGNIRELENAVERIMVTCPDEVIRNTDYLKAPQTRSPEDKQQDFPADFDYRSALEEYDKELIINALSRFRTSRRAAEQLGVSQPTIIRKAARYGIKIGRSKGKGDPRRPNTHSTESIDLSS